LIDREWKTTIEADKSLYEAYAAELRRIFIDPERYRWVYSKSGSDFVRFKGALESAGMPPNLLRVVSYAAARPQIEREWTLVVDSEDDEVCGRGPLALTYRQGYRLGLLDLQLDALVERQIADSSDPAPKKAALRSTASGVDASADFGDDRIESAGAQLQGGAECLYVEGGDDRNDPKELATAVQEKIGGGARKLPKENQAYWIAARLTKLYAMDFKRGYEELVFDATKPPSTQMELENIKANRTAYAVNQAAAVIARAVAIPCLATLDKDIQASPPPYMGELPQLGNCAIVKAFVEYDRL
jgi:hypothetical protein